MMINCDESVMICDKSQYGEATLWQRFKHWLHLQFCKACASHTAKNTRLTHLCEKAQMHRLEEREKARLKENISREDKRLNP